MGIKNQGLSVYEKELMAILVAVDHWRHYLEAGEFVIKIDQESIKYILQQKLHTHLQKKGMTELLGLNYTILYRKGAENLAVDALFRRGWSIIPKEDHDVMP